MADSLMPESKREFLEKDIAHLSEVVARHQEQPESRELSDEAIVRKALREFGDKEPIPNAPTPPSTESMIPEYAVGAPTDAKLEVEYLLDVASREGIRKADAAARNASPFVLDAFHDALSKLLVPKLRDQGSFK